MPLTISANARALSLVGALVDDDAENPTAVGHDAAGTDDQREFQAVEGDGAVAAAIDAVDHEGIAMLMRRRFLRVRVDARTEIVAVATFHVLAAQLPGLFSHPELLWSDVQSIAGPAALAIDQGKIMTRHFGEFTFAFSGAPPAEDFS